ncbi:hypothetical protein KG091_07850 [Carnobacteriaceae bacterium zg-ZUI78]|nr:hypothetical protein [Carnobacteriaceae bacterium zg-ZUI78]
MALEKIAKELELVEVSYEGQKAVLTFLDREEGLIRKINFNKQSYDEKNKKFIDDVEKAEKVEAWCQEYFGTTFDTLTDAMGQNKDVYVYDGFNSLFEVAQIDKFSSEMEGDIFNTEIDSIEDTGTKISVQYYYEGKLYESKFQYAKYVETLKEWFTDPNDKKKAFEKFEKKFGVSFDEKESLIGKTIMVEVKKAGGKWLYGEIKQMKVKK